MIETLYDTMRPLLKARNRLSLPHREMLLALCILTLATAIYLKDVLFLGQRLLPADLLTISEPWRSISDQQVIHNYNLSDPIQTHYPRQIYFWHSLQQGHYPTWNPYIFLGIPCDPMTVGIFADIGQIVTSWPSFFLPLDIAWGIVAALRLVLAGFFMYLLMRHFKASFSGALLSAIIFMFGANTIVWLEYPHHLATQLWMPLIFLFFDRMLVTRRWVDALLTTVFLSLMLYTRYLQLTFYVMLTLIPYFLWHLWRAYDQERDWHTIAKMILLTTVAVGGALMMASVKIAVFHQATLHSIRAGQDRAPTALTLASLPTHLISRLVTFYFPTFYSDGITYPYWGPGNTVEASQYVALLPLFLIAIAITHWSHQRRSLFFVGLGAALLLIRMRVPPLANIISALPFMNVGSISRLTTVITFVLAIIAGLGLTALEQKGRIKKRTVIGAISGTLVIGFFIVGAAWWIYRQKLSIRPYTINNLWSVLAMTGVLLGWLYLFLERNTRRRVMALGMVCLTFVDLLAFGGNFNTTASPEMVYPSTGATDFLLRDPTAFRVLVLHDANNPHEIAPSDTLQTYQIPEVGGRNPHLPQQYYDFFSQVLEEPGVTPNGYLLPAKFQKPALWGMLNVKYILTKKALPKNQMESLHLVYDDELKIYRTTAWLPRIFAVTKVR
ncbi:MAG: hypothetical protein SVX38_15455, partial [Chloroflexota bacterium]|nr:hypothetical protein [Chloroflexota bacterium]